MTRQRARNVFVVLVFAVATGLAGSWPQVSARVADLPAKLTDKEFWDLSEQISESGGEFRSDNFLSNERGVKSRFAGSVPDCGKAILTWSSGAALSKSLNSSEVKTMRSMTGVNCCTDDTVAVLRLISRRMRVTSCIKNCLPTIAARA